MPITKDGEQISWKEFMSRWKKGIEGINPLQQLKTQLIGTIIILIGLLAGIIICTLGIKNLWWLLLILIGGLFNTVVQLLGQYQKYIQLKSFYLNSMEVYNEQ